VNTGSVVVNIFNSGTVYPEWNLIGKPYPSYIKLLDFLNANNLQFLSPSAAIYGYNDNTDTEASGKWTIWNLAYALANSNKTLTPGQGFLVSSKVDGGSITFNPSIRTNGSGDDFIIGRETQRNEIAHLRLQMTSDSDLFSTDFYFTDNASRGLDVGYDATVFNNVAPDFAIYSALVEDNEGNDIAIQSVGYNEYNNNISIPLGINAIQGQQITITIENTTLPGDVEVYIEDSVLNTFTLLNDSDYVFNADSNLSGIGRYYLRFASQTLTNPEYELNNLSIYTTTSPKTVVIKGQINDDTVANIYDIQGRLVHYVALKTGVSINELDVDNFSAGVYIIKLESDTHGKTQKIIIR
jgi:hypothetical protein